MASTIPLSRTIAFAKTYLQIRPLTGVGNDSNNPLEPAITIGDWVRNFILAPPFAWRWNRVENTSTTITGASQDYPILLNDFGWLEKAYITDGGTAFKELQIRLDLALDGTPNEPAFISPYKDDNAGNITFRVFPLPDKSYTLKLTYQKASPSFEFLADFWSPIPDYFSNIYNSGFLAKAYEMANDERFGVAHQLFVKQLIAANGGLTESQKNLFLGERDIMARNMQDATGNAAISRASRALLPQGQ